MSAVVFIRVPISVCMDPASVKSLLPLCGTLPVAGHFVTTFSHFLLLLLLSYFGEITVLLMPSQGFHHRAAFRWKGFFDEIRLESKRTKCAGW